MAREVFSRGRDSAVPAARDTSRAGLEVSPLQSVLYARGPRENNASALADVLGVVAAPLANAIAGASNKAASGKTVAAEAAFQAGQPLSPELAKSREASNAYNRLSRRAELEDILTGTAKEIDEFVTKNNGATADDVSGIIDARVKEFLYDDNGALREDLGDVEDQKVLLTRIAEARGKLEKGARDIIVDRVETKAAADATRLALSSVQAAIANPSANGLDPSVRGWSQVLDGIPSEGAREKAKESIIATLAAQADVEKDPRYLTALLNEKDANGGFVVTGKDRQEVADQQDRVSKERDDVLKANKAAEKEAAEVAAWSEFGKNGSLSAARMIELERIGVNTGQFRSIMSFERVAASAQAAANTAAAAADRMARRERSDDIAAAATVGLANGTMTTAQALRLIEKGAETGEIDKGGINAIIAGIGKAGTIRKALLADPSAAADLSDFRISRKAQLEAVKNYSSNPAYRQQFPNAAAIRADQAAKAARVERAYIRAEGVYGDTLVRTKDPAKARQAAEATIASLLRPTK